MPGEVIGSLTTRLGVDASEHRVEFERAASRTRRFAVETNQAGRSVGGLTSILQRNQRGLLELSRGVEDFSAVVGTTGLAGGLRAASNNISQFFALMNPLGGAIAGVGVALGTILIPKLLGAGNAAESAKEKVKSLRSELDAIGEARGRAREVDRLLIGAPEGRRNEIADLRARAGDRQAQQALLARRESDLVRQSQELRLSFRPDRIAAGLAASLFGDESFDLVPTSRAKRAMTDLAGVRAEQTRLAEEAARDAREENRLRRSLPQGLTGRPSDALLGFAFNNSLDRAARLGQAGPGSLVRRLFHPTEGLGDFAGRLSGFRRGFPGDFRNLLRAGSTIGGFGGLGSLLGLFAEGTGTRDIKSLLGASRGALLPRSAQALLGGSPESDVALAQSGRIASFKPVTKTDAERNTNKLVNKLSSVSREIVGAIGKISSVQVAEF